MGVSSYESHLWGPATGADVDTNNVREYLLVDLRVPAENVIILQNSDATRRNIISNFTQHLINNRRINTGDAILFHFSGHGSRAEAPQGWPVIQDDDSDEGTGKLEVIIPYDEGMLDENGETIASIPDTTLAALLYQTAERHGRNITAVLDCCSSGHGTRSGHEGEEPEFVVRGVDPSLLSPLQKTTDEHIWGSFLQVTSSSDDLRGASTGLFAKSHILIAACDKRQQALGGKRGGLLTKHWLKALRDPGIQPRSYVQIIKAVRKGVEHDLRRYNEKYNLSLEQRPHYEGVLCDRLVFANMVIEDVAFSAFKDDRGCRITAGELHGVQNGTVFGIHAKGCSDLDPDPVVGTAIVFEVQSTYCLASISDDVHLDDPPYTARHIFPLKYTLVNTEPGSEIALATFQSIETVIHSMPQRIRDVVKTAEHPDDAGLVLEVHGRNNGGVILKRKDAILGNLGTIPPELDSGELRDVNLPNLLNAISRFNFYIAQANQNPSFSKDVTVELRRLKDSACFDIESSDPSRGLEQQILPQGDRFQITNSDDDEYAFVLKNQGETPLFVYMIFFDPGTYEISNLYCPPDSKHPVLLPERTLQLGASPEHRDGFSFFMREKDEIDTCFIKFFFLDSFTSMSFVEQKNQVGRDEYGTKYIQPDRANNVEEGITNPPRKGNWDCLTLRLDITRDPEL